LFSGNNVSNSTRITNQGIEHMMKGEYNKALECFDTVIQLDPNNQAAWLYKAFGLQRLDSHNEAIKSFDKAIELKPDDFDAWQSRGFSLSRIGENNEANKCFDKAIKIASDLKDNTKLYVAHVQRGVNNIRTEQEDAEKDFKKAFELLPSLGVDPAKGVARSSPFANLFIYISNLKYMMGKNAQARGDKEEAITYYDEALKKLQLLIPENKQGEMLMPNRQAFQIYIDMGQTYQDMAKFEDAEKSFNSALSLSVTIAEKELEADSYLRLSNLYFNFLNRFEDARKCCDAVIERTKDPGLAATALHLKGGADLALGLYHEALQCHKKEAEYFRSIGDIRSETAARSGMASDLSIMGRSNEAIVTLESVLDSYTKLGLKIQMIYTLCGIAQENRALGDYEAALTTLSDAQKKASDFGNPSLEAQCLVLQGDIHLYLHSWNDAQTCYEQAFDLFSNSNKRATDQYLKVRTLIGLSSIHLNKKNYKEAQTYSRDAIDVCNFNEPRLDTTKASVYQQLSEIYSAQKKYSEAIESLKSALDIYNKLGMLRQQAQMYLNMSQLLLEAKENANAMSNNDKAVEIYCKIGGIQDEILTCKNVASQIYYDDGRLEEARKILEDELLKINAETIDPNILAHSYVGLAAISRKIGNETQAASNLVKAVNKLDSVRSKITSGDLRISFQGQETTAYKVLVESCFSLGNIEKSFEYMEKSKSRVLIEQIRTTRLRKPQGVSEEIQKREDELLDDMNAAISTNLKGQRAYEIEKELDELWFTMQELYPSSAEVKEYLSLRRGGTLDSIQFIDLLRDTDNVSIVEYYILNNKILIFLTSSKTNKLETYSKQIDREILKKHCDDFISYIEDKKVSKQPIYDLEKSFEEMSSCLIEPIAGVLNGVKHLHIVPDSFLHGFPIHALSLNGQRLIDKCSISYSDSASTLKYCLSRPSRKIENVLVIGVPPPDLDFAEVEAKEISAILHCQPDIGRDVTKQYVKSSIGGKDVVSFSCHSKFYADAALNSGIILPSREKLTARELFQIRTSADLVSLSACESGRSEEKPGDEMLGLVRSIIFAGAKSVLASLWRVDDLATYVTMTKFYEEFYTKQLNKSQALRAAQLYVRDLNAKDLLRIVERLTAKNYPIQEDLKVGLELRAVHEPEKKIFQDIYDWSPFVIIGDWH
jgi:tetratricopeptide (TPR) repeat protein